MKKISEDSILSYIEDHLEEHLTADHVADAFGYSPDHFRHLFRTYYDISLGEYMRRRRLVGAAKQIQNGESVNIAAQKYDFQTAAGFSKAFRKEFGFPASELKTQKDIFLDELPDPVYDRNLIRVSCMEIPELKTVGRPLLPKKEFGYDLLEEAACWLEQDSCDIGGGELQMEDSYPGDFIAMWYHDPDNVAITYLIGPVMKNFRSVPPDWVPVTIPGRKYAIFETKRDSDQQRMVETVRMLCKYIFWEWVPANSIITDKMGFTFERYLGKKAAVYLPLL